MTLELPWDRPPAPVSDALRQVDELPAAPTAPGRLRSWFRTWDPGSSRTTNYLPAIDRVHALATSNTPLTWTAICEVQGTLLGLPGPAPFRTGPAFARGGKLRYAWLPDAEAMLSRKLEVDAADGCHPLIQAARAYLDLIHFHPFNDANTRASSLWLHYFLCRANLPTPPIAPLLVLRQRPGDPDRAWAFTTLLAKLVLQTARADHG
ncbi:Fic family protein [Planctomycetota bacterium]|nr:Fic family protein [Planctomycetota bacterium]